MASARLKEGYQEYMDQAAALQGPERHEGKELATKALFSLVATVILGRFAINILRGVGHTLGMGEASER